MTFINIRDTSGRQNSLQATREGTLRVTGVLNHGTEFNPDSLSDAKQLITYLENWVKNRQELPVIFRKFEGEITAVFPTLPASRKRQHCTCYTHTDEHGECSKDWYLKTMLATPEEYADLLAELTEIYCGCTLVVVQRWVPQYDTLRLAELNK